MRVILAQPRGFCAGVIRAIDIVGPDTDDICYATPNRQSAVRELAKVVDVILVVGAKNSSNSNRLREIGVEIGVPSYLIADGSELQSGWFREADVVGITAGASAPEELVDDVVVALRSTGPIEGRCCPASRNMSNFAFSSNCFAPALRGPQRPD
jgi:4-hydroxy-3-methylbut-2-enyl diphosphate reductase